VADLGGCVHFGSAYDSAPHCGFVNRAVLSSTESGKKVSTYSIAG
jgi:hypothetical protein